MHRAGIKPLRERKYPVLISRKIDNEICPKLYFNREDLAKISIESLDCVITSCLFV